MLLYLLVLSTSMALAKPAMDGDMAELAAMLRSSCVDETGVDEALLKGIDGGATLQPDPKLKCYMKCVMETGGMLSEGVVDIEAVLALVPEDFKLRNEAKIRECGSPAGSDHCDVAYNTQVCWQKSNPKDYFLV